jgi:hypothetical protein
VARILRGFERLEDPGRGFGVHPAPESRTANAA